MERKFIETELGRIPSDWIVTTIKDAGTAITDGINPQKYRESEFCEYSMPAYDCGMSPNICKGSSMNSNRTKISGEVLLFNKLNVRQRRVWYVENAPANSVCSMEFLAYKSNVICLPLLCEILLQDKVTNDFISVSRGTSNSQKRIAPSDFWNYKVAVPADIKEQQRIASCLSSINEMISKLTESIEKKQLIKEGLMQELLTGKKRLKGFNGEWQSVRMEEIEIKNGSMLKSSEYEPGNVPVIAGGVSAAGYHSKANRPSNTITISGSGANAGFVNFFEEPIFASDCSTINEQKSIYVKYLYYALLLKQPEIYKCQAGGAQPHIHAKDIKDIVIPMPTLKDEQVAVASVLTEIDKQIIAIESQRDKYLLIKQGMMQQLLTGKTRL